MKKIFLFATVMLLLGAALPKAKAQFSKNWYTKDFAHDAKCDAITHPLQEIRAIYIDVCDEPEKNWSSPSEFTAPKLKFTREAMIFNTVNFVIAPYNNRIDAVRDWILQIDFGDGLGFINIAAAGITRTVTYPVGSSPTMFYKGAIEALGPIGSQTSGTNLKPLFIKNPVNAYVAPDKIWKINAGKYTPPAYAAQSYGAGDPVLAATDAEGFAYIKLALGHTKLTKPIIFVDGVDFSSEKLRYTDDNITLNTNYESRIVRCGGTGWDIFIRGAEDSWAEPNETESFREYPQMFDDLTGSGFDVIFLDFAEGATFIQKNSMVLKALITRINNEKDAEAKEENIVVGASMGGQVARMALAQMERDKQNHCTRMYVSFDSPQKGANIPLSLQGFSWLAAYTELLPDNWISLNTPAAKQMLIETLADDVVKGKLTLTLTKDGTAIPNPLFRPNTLRPAFVAEMAALGYPQKVENISIVDGDERGRKITGDVGVPFPNNAPMLSVQPSFLGLVGVPIVTANLFALNGASNFGNGIPNATVFSGNIPLKIHAQGPVNLGISAQEMTKAVFTLNQTLPTFDNAPGCMRGDLRGIRRLVNDGQTALTKATGGLFTLAFPAAGFQPNFCFMPTMSTLDIRNPNNPNEWNWDINPSILQNKIKDAKITQNQLTPFFDYYAPETGNLRHVEIDPLMREWIKQFLKDTDKDDLTKYKVLPYNGKPKYAYNYRKNHITSVSVNPEGTLSVNDGGNYSAFNSSSFYERPVFEAHLGDYCGGATVTVNGGKLILGSLTNKDRSAIVTMTDGNTIELKSGELSLYNNSQIVVKDGGKLIISGGTLNLVNTNSRIIIKKGGVLEVRSAIKVNGDGFIEFEQGNIVDVKVPALQLTGSGKNKRFIQIDNNATLKTENVSLYINMGAITYAKNASIVVKNAPSIHINYVTANGTNTNEVAFNLLKCNGNIYVSNSDFNNLNRGFLIQDKQSGTFGSDYSTFTHCELGITSNGGGGNYILSQNTTFMHNGIGCDLRNQSGNIELWSTIFRYNNFGLYLSKNSQTVRVVSCSFAENHEVGILTEGIPSLVVSSGTFYKHNNEAFAQAENFTVEVPAYNPPTAPCFEEDPCFAIYNAENSNIVLTDGTLFKDNNFGVYKADPSSFGGNADALVIDCTTFDNNIYAVKGKDIEVMADAQLNQQTPNKSVRSNNFIQGKEGQFFFDICYGKFNNKSSTIYLRENYWETIANGAGNKPDPNLISFKEFCDDECASCRKLGNCIPYNDDNFLPQPNSKCFPVGKPPKGGGGTLSDEYLKTSPASSCDRPIKGGFAGENTPVHAQYRYAYFGLFDPKSNIDEVMSSFARVAETPLEKEDASVCAQYIRVARAFTDMYPDEKGTFSSKVQKTKTLTNVYPNPADNILNIHVEKGAYSLNIMDVQGRVVYTEEAEGDIVINTSTWQSGVYQVLVTDKTSGQKSIEKVVIMR